MHAGEPARAGAAHQAQQKRFRLIVASMADRDEIGAARQPGALEEFVTRGASGVLDRTVFPAGARGDIPAIDVIGRSSAAATATANRSSASASGRS